MTKRPLAEVLETFYAIPKQFAQSDVKNLKTSKKPAKTAKHFQTSPGPIYDIATKIGSTSPSFSLHQKHVLAPPATPGPKYEISVKKPQISASIQLRRPDMTVKAPPARDYDVQKAFHFTKPSRQISIPPTEIVQKVQKSPDFVCLKERKTTIVKSLGVHRDMRLYNVELEQFPAPNRYNVVRGGSGRGWVLPECDQGVVDRICSEGYVNKDARLIRVLGVGSRK